MNERERKREKHAERNMHECIFIVRKKMKETDYNINEISYLTYLKN